MPLHLLSRGIGGGLALLAAACSGGASEAGPAPLPSASTASSAASTAPPVARGPALAGRHCAGCHGGDLGGTRVGGWAPNLTPDPDTGLGGWQPEEIRLAVRLGVDRDGVTLCSTMPRFSSATLSEDDLTVLIEYLRSLAPLVRPALGGCGG